MMRGLLKASLLLAPALVSSLVVPTDEAVEDVKIISDHSLAFVGVEVVSTDDERTEALPFRLDVFPSEEACGYANVTVNGQVMPQTWKGERAQDQGSITFEEKNVIGGSWSFQCIKVNGQPDSQLMKFTIDTMDGKRTKLAGFTALFRQTGLTEIITIGTDLKASDEMLANPNPESLETAGQNHGDSQFRIEQEIDELHWLKAQMREVEYLIWAKEQSIAEFESAQFEDDFQECDSLRCVAKAVIDRASKAAHHAMSKIHGFGDEEEHSGPGHKSKKPQRFPGHEKHGEHGRPGEHQKHGNHTSGHHSNHTGPPHHKKHHHRPLPVCRYPPPFGKGGPPGNHHHHPPPPHGERPPFPPHGGPPEHHGAPHPQPHHEFPEDGDMPPPPPGHHHDFPHDEPEAHHGGPDHEMRPHEGHHGPPFDGPHDGPEAHGGPDHDMRPHEGHHGPPFDGPPFDGPHPHERPEGHHHDGPDREMGPPHEGHHGPPPEGMRPHDGPFDDPHHEDESVERPHGPPKEGMGPEGDFDNFPPPPPPHHGPEGDFDSFPLPPPHGSDFAPDFLPESPFPPNSFAGPGPHRGPPPPPIFHIAKLVTVGILISLFLAALQRRICASKRAARHARRSERHQVPKNAFTRFFARLSGGRDYDDDYEEKRRGLLEDAEDGMSTTMTEEITELRNAVEIVDDIVVETGRSVPSVTSDERPLMAEFEIGSQDGDEDLPAYEAAEEDSEGSEMSVVADGFRYTPGGMEQEYTPDHSVDGSVSDVLGNDRKE